MKYELPVKYGELDWQTKRGVRGQYVEEQNGTCYFCRGKLSMEPNKDKKINWRLFPQNFLKHPVHLHHSHKTGLTIGAVHAYCNAVLWQYYGE